MSIITESQKLQKNSTFSSQTFFVSLSDVLLLTLPAFFAYIIKDLPPTTHISLLLAHFEDLFNNSSSIFSFWINYSSSRYQVCTSIVFIHLKLKNSFTGVFDTFFYPKISAFFRTQKKKKKKKKKKSE